MQLLSTRETRQLALTAQAAWDALVLVEDATCHTLDRLLVAATSPQAIRAYRLGWAIIRETVLLTAAAAFYSGVLTRHATRALMSWADGYIADCQTLPVVAEVEQIPDPWEIPTPPLPVAPLPPLSPSPQLLLPPARESAVSAAELPTTIRELRKLCKAQGHKGAGRWTKEQCLAALAPIGVSAAAPQIRRRRRTARPESVA